MDIIGNELTDLGNAVEAIPDRVASEFAEFAEFAASCAVQGVVPIVVPHDVKCSGGRDVHEHKSQTFDDQDFDEHDPMQFTEVDLGGTEVVGSEVVAADVVGSDVVG